jgi:hypothetical protein
MRLGAGPHLEGTSEIQRLVIGRTLADTAPPLHHRLPTDGPALGRAFGRGSKPRSLAARRAIRPASKTPPSLMKLPMKAIAPPPPKGGQDSRAQ